MNVGNLLGESIKSAIAKKIATSISPIPTMYKEPIPQGMVLPSIFIRTLEVSQEKMIGTTFNRAYQMNIRYHPVTDDPTINENLEAMANKLMVYLSWIEVPIFLGNYDDEDQPIEELKPVVGRQMDYTITDNVLQLFVTYSVRGKTLPSAAVTMQHVEVNQI